MSQIKTKVTDASVEEFVDRVNNQQRREDAKVLLDMFRRVTGQEPKMWGPSMIGYDQYHYKSDRSRQEGDWPMVGFSPRQSSLTLYVMTGFADFDDLLAKLGKHKTSVGCLYINKLADVDAQVLEQIIDRCYQAMKRQYGSTAN